jgi:hypothetical protein
MNTTSTLKLRAEPNRSRQLDQGGLIFGLLGAENGSLDGFKVRVTVLDVLSVPAVRFETLQHILSEGALCASIFHMSVLYL